MKKILLALGLILLLAACGNEEAVTEKQEEAQENVQSEVINTDENKEDGQDNGKLENVGDKITNDPETGGTVELMAVKEINETIDLSAVKITINNIKIIRMSDIKNPDFLFLASQFTDETTFDYVQIMYEIENTEDTNVRLNSPIKAIVLNTGEQIESFESDMAYDDNFAKTLYGKVKNESFVSLVMESDAEDINEIKIITGRIDHGDTAETLADEQTVTYEIN